MRRLARSLIAFTALATWPAWGAQLPPFSPNMDLSQNPVTALGGAVARTEAARAADTVNALDYGLVCDGSTDSGPAIAKINLLTGSGRTIFFPPQNRVCLSSVALAPASGTFVYAFPGTVVLQPTAGSTANPLLFNVGGKSNISAHGLTFDGAYQTIGNGNPVSLVYSADHIVFDHVTWQNTRGIPLLFSTNISYSGVRSSVVTKGGAYYLISGAASDQLQGIDFCCGTAGNKAGNAAQNHDNFVVDTSFNIVGLDALAAADQTNFIANGNRFNNVGGLMSNGGAAIWLSNVWGGTVVGNAATGAAGNGLDLSFLHNLAINGNHIEGSGGGGIVLSSSDHVAITNNICSGNFQSRNLATPAQFQAGIAMALGTGTSNMNDILVSGNICTDTQTTQTQNYGFQQYGTVSTLTNLYVDQTNNFAGNKVSDFGGNATGYSPLKVASSNAAIQQTGASPNYGVSLLPTTGGTGGLTGNLHDGSNTGGGPIGKQAVDWCLGKTSANHVASGQGAGCTNGASNVASGAFSQAGGNYSTADSQYARAYGGFAQARYRNGDFFAAGQTSSNGDSQRATHIFRTATTSTTPKRLTTDGSGNANTSNCANLPNINFGANQESIAQYGIRVTATDLTNPGNFLSYYEPMGTIYRSSTMASTSYVSSGSAVSKSIGTAGSVSITADTTNACPAVTWTAPNADTWHVLVELSGPEGF